MTDFVVFLDDQELWTKCPPERLAPSTVWGSHEPKCLKGVAESGLSREEVRLDNVGAGLSDSPGN